MLPIRKLMGDATTPLETKTVVKVIVMGKNTVAPHRVALPRAPDLLALNPLKPVPVRCPH